MRSFSMMVFLLLLAINTAPAQNAKLIVYQPSIPYVMDSEGKNLRALKPVDGYEWHGSPAFSPDGKFLAWDAHQEDLTNPAIFMQKLAKDKVTKLTDGKRPLWLDNDTLLISKDEKILKFTREGKKVDTLAKGKYPELSANRRWLIYTNGTKVVVRNLKSQKETTVAPKPAMRSFNGVSVSSNGKRFAYVGSTGGGQGVFLADVADGKGKQIADLPGQEYFPDFSPDDSKILITAGSLLIGPKQPVSRIYRIDVKSGNTTPLTDESRHCRDASWSHDGKRIALTGVDAK